MSYKKDIKRMCEREAREDSYISASDWGVLLDISDIAASQRIRERLRDRPDLKAYVPSGNGPNHFVVYCKFNDESVTVLSSYLSTRPHKTRSRYKLTERAKTILPPKAKTPRADQWLWDPVTNEMVYE